MLDSKTYRGLKKNRAKGKDYDLFMKAFIYSVKNHAPKIFLHWEDFTSNQAHRNLKTA